MLRRQTLHLALVLQTPDEVRAQIDRMTDAEKAELSADWLAKMEAAKSPDPWVHGFNMIDRKTGAAVGSCGFKGRPTDDGVVEIAYGVHPDHQGKGFATEAAEALVAYAFGTGDVRIVRAHTLPESNASTRVLTKCGFEFIGEVADPDDGLVWRWERRV